MADSVDRVFVHALNTVKRIPKTGASRPPPVDRMRLYGLYKQAMEGDVDGVMERPTAASLASTKGTSPPDHFAAEDLAREQDKWDAWNSQKGLSPTEAKRRYIEALIETMHKYATTPNAVELVAELEFVWNQIKDNCFSSTGSSPGSATRRFQQPLSGTEGPLKELSPMSEEDASEQRLIEEDGDEEAHGNNDGAYVKKGDKWSRKMERAIVRLSAEIAALREQISTGREWKTRKERSIRAWVSWFFWLSMKHFVFDVAVLAILLWMRRRKDRRLEHHVHGVLRLGREYMGKILPS